MEKVEIIAEIGENHLGNLNLARQLIHDAAIAGVDTVKFQSYSPDCIKQNDPERDWFLKVRLSNSDHFTLKKEAERHGLKFLSSPFSMERAYFLVAHLMTKQLKIASCMIYNMEFLRYVNNLAKHHGLRRVYISTGMAELSEIDKCLSYLYDVPEKYLMHCVSLYPCSPDKANLNAIVTLRHRYAGIAVVGYSDHTVGIYAPVMAAMLGAQVIEKHFTFDVRCTEGTDHCFSADLPRMKKMVTRIREMKDYLSDGFKIPCEEELEVKEFMMNRFLV